MTTQLGTITSAGVDQEVTLVPGASDNIAAVIFSGDFSGFEAIIETSANGTFSDAQPLVGVSMQTYLPDGPFVAPQGGQSNSWGFNITTANKAIRVRPLAYGSGTINVAMVSAVLAGGIPIVNTTQTQVSAGLTGAAAAIAPSMPAVAGKFNYVTGISIDGKGATAGSIQAALLSGLPKTLAFVFVVPAGANTPLGGGKVSIAFNPPLQASGINTAVTLSVPSFGVGNTSEIATISGYTQ